MSGRLEQEPTVLRERTPREEAAWHEGYAYARKLAGADCGGYKYGHCGCTCHPLAARSERGDSIDAAAFREWLAARSEPLDEDQVRAKWGSLRWRANEEIAARSDPIETFGHPYRAPVVIDGHEYTHTSNCEWPAALAETEPKP